MRKKEKFFMEHIFSLVKLIFLLYSAISLLLSLLMIHIHLNSQPTEHYLPPSLPEAIVEFLLGISLITFVVARKLRIPLTVPLAGIIACYGLSPITRLISRVRFLYSDFGASLSQSISFLIPFPLVIGLLSIFFAFLMIRVGEKELADMTKKRYMEA